MPIYKSAEQLNRILNQLFGSIGESPELVQTLVRSRLIIRIHTSDPASQVLINGRQNPPQVSYDGARPSSPALRPDLDIEVKADALHNILLSQLGLAKAIGSGQMKARGAIHKSFVLEAVLHRGQQLYPPIARQEGLIN